MLVSLCGAVLCCTTYLMTVVICSCVRVTVYYLVYLLPAILIHTADLCMVMQQQFTAVGVSSYH